MTFGVHQFGRHVPRRTSIIGLRRRVDAIESVDESRHTKVAQIGAPILVDDDIILQTSTSTQGWM